MLKFYFQTCVAMKFVDDDDDDDDVDMQMLVGVMDDIQKHYVDSKAEDGRLWVEGQIAISQFTDDGLFYRARVLNVIDADTVEVSSGIFFVLGN